MKVKVLLCLTNTMDNVNIIKRMKTTKMKILLCLTNTMKQIWRRIFNSTCPPSGNLVDGLPLDLHTDAR